MIIYDGHEYNSHDDIPDFGSITLVNVVENKRIYRGLKKDFGKLPKYDDMATGSTCLFLDTNQTAEYLAYNKSWYLLNRLPEDPVSF